MVITSEPVRRAVLLAALIATLDGCSDAGQGSPSKPVVSATAAVSPDNDLALLVSAAVTDADSVRVVSIAGGTRTALTPYFDASGTQVRVPVLALKPATAYSLSVDALGPGGAASSASFSITTGDLPDVLKPIRMRTVKGASSAGYLLTAINFASDVYAVAFDSTGSIVWYRRFPNGLSSLDMSQQPNGNFTIFTGLSHGWEPVPGQFIEFTPAGEQVRTWTAPAGYYLDGHEFLLTNEQGVSQPVGHMLTYTLRSIDAQSVGGSAAEEVTQHALHRVRQAGPPELVWDSWNVFTLGDWIEPPRLPPSDIDHPNSLTLDSDGNYIVSWRNTGEITKINRATGQIIWRLGGAHNEFQFIGDPLSGFSAQHYARMTPAGTLLLYDNGWRHSPSQSRAVEYRLDVTAKTATLIREFRHDPPLFTQFVGSVQRLPGNNTLVGWAQVGLATEYNPAGAVTWEGQIEFGTAVPSVYRIQKTYSLYAFATP